MSDPSSSNSPKPDRGELVDRFLDQLPFAPYRVQEDALLAWFDENDGILVCTPTGTGKTLIAEAAIFEALHSGTCAYYTTPLIALTEQKFREIQAAAVRWGFSADDVGLVTGNRKVNPQARILVVVAEILLNRLLHSEGFDFGPVSAVIMDEFHSFNDPERGVVWELTLALLPAHVRLMLLSATVGNPVDFLLWLQREHGRRLQLVQGSERKVPLEFQWVGGELLADFLEQMQEGTETTRRTPALVFCFNREECWSVAEQLKGRSLLREGQQAELAAQLDHWDWKHGAGPKLKQILLRGVGVHHAGLLPKYRRRVEHLFQQKLLSVCLCTETLAAGINLPARSVVMTSLVKGPPGKKVLVEAGTAHQMFGRAGRPQFDTTGYVFAMAHEDDVRIARWKEQYDQIPENTKDPNLIRMKKKLKKKMPVRRKEEQYWNAEQFQKLIAAPPAPLVSKGRLPWRLLAYLLTLSPDVNRLLSFVRQRLLPAPQREHAGDQLLTMLRILESGDFVTLFPAPSSPLPKVQRDWPVPVFNEESPADAAAPPSSDGFGAGLLEETGQGSQDLDEEAVPEETAATAEESADSEATNQIQGSFGALLQEALAQAAGEAPPAEPGSSSSGAAASQEPSPEIPQQAYPNERLNDLLLFRSCHPLYATFLMDHLGIADRIERIQILESVLEVPGSVVPLVRVPPPTELPPGPLARGRIDPELLARGLITQRELDPSSLEPELDSFGKPIRQWAVPLGDKMRRLFDAEYPGVQDLRTRSVWIAGDLLQVGGDFHKYVTTRNLTRQEGVFFRHLLRLMLLCEEFKQICPVGVEPASWTAELDELQQFLMTSCHEVDPESTDRAREQLEADADLLMS